MQELLNSELQKITSKGSIENNILDVIGLFKSSFLLPSHHLKGCYSFSLSLPRIETGELARISISYAHSLVIVWSSLEQRYNNFSPTFIYS